jgi:RND family efflux transporter MFP subunit
VQRDVASAALEQAKARLDARNVTLNYTRITSPIDGRVGHSNFHAGSLVNPASGVLVEVVQLDPIRIAFALEEGAFATKAGQHADISAMKQAWQVFIDSNGQRIRGELTSVDNRIDPRTASVMLRAGFANPRHQLLPGGNVNVTLRPASEQPVLTLPPPRSSRMATVLCLSADGNAEKRPLKIAGQIGQFQIASGVKPGERAITDGAQRVQPGAAVQILN